MTRREFVISSLSRRIKQPLFPSPHPPTPTPGTYSAIQGASTCSSCPAGTWDAQCSLVLHIIVNDFVRCLVSQPETSASLSSLFLFSNFLDLEYFQLLLVCSTAENFDPFDLLCIVLMQEVTVQQEHLRRLLVLQVSWSGMPPSIISGREGLDGVAHQRP